LNASTIKNNHHVLVGFVLYNAFIQGLHYTISHYCFCARKRRFRSVGGIHNEQLDIIFWGLSFTD
jgi:hypothetical protein